MRVQEVVIDGKRKYLLLNGGSVPIPEVMHYLKYLDSIDKAENTIKAYCHHLKLYYAFLEEKGKTFEEATLQLLGEFIGWLRTPEQSTKVGLSQK